MTSDALVAAAASRQRRRLIAASAIAAFLAFSPKARSALLEVLNQIFTVLRNRFGPKPALKKDFLQEAQLAQLGSAGASSARQAGGGGYAPPRQQQRNWGDDGDAPPAQWDDPNAPRFSDFGAVFPPWLSEGLRRGGFNAMKPIQQKVLPLALQGKDVVGIAPTGSGKTLGFLIPGIVHATGQPQSLRPSDGPIVLILAPTRELAVQIGTVADGLLKPSREQDGRPTRGGGGFHSAVLYGGPRRTDQLQTLQFQKSTHVIVATPGRLLDFIRSGAFTLRRVSFFVLDEGDRMLDFGFEPDVAAISAQIRADRQMMFFSATWPPEVEDAAKRLCSKGQVFEKVSATALTDANGGCSPNAEEAGTRSLELPGHAGITLPPKEIQQIVEVINAGNQWNYNGAMDRKLPMLFRYLEEALGGIGGETPGKALIFVSTRNGAEELGIQVARYFGLDRCGIMHGARKQDQREATLKAFRDGRLRALVATDVLGRGVDIAGVSHVVIFDFPSDIETYVHRVGRTGRNGQPGTAIAFYEPQPWMPDLSHELAEVLRACGQPLPEALAQEERNNMPGGWNAWSSDAANAPLTSPLQAPPPLEDRGCPKLATSEELGAWGANGARVWGYSANGGVSEQGRLELREKGILRTTWGWGEWSLVPSAPHCPPPSRPCPTPAGQDGEAKVQQESPKPVETIAPPKPLSGETHLALTWSGVTDIVALDSTGMGFELVSRNARPASTYKKQTLGRALVDVEM